ncbi:MAG: DMT family transporter [Desulfobacterales bacterium]|nr:DMT family transporter [Desulfobacterales bacterium]
MTTKSQIIKSDVYFLITAATWGFAFVAQRLGMEYVGPFTFNGARFFLGTISLLPLLFFRRNPKQKKTDSSPVQGKKYYIIGSGLAGLILFLGASFQQAGLVYTTAGKAGFITGLYVIIVPVISLLLGKRFRYGTWTGAILATIGLYLLTVSGKFSINLGDFLVLCSAIFWAAHVLLIGRLSLRVDPIKIAVFQFAVCACLSTITAFIFEHVMLQNIIKALIPIMYAGFLSVGIAYTLQIVAQQYANPTHAAIMLSLEAVFAVAGGWIFLNEALSVRNIIGCLLMLAGMLISQLTPRK